MRNAYGLTDEGFARLEALTNLESLNLYCIVVHHGDLRHIAGLTKLRSLDLTGTEMVGDAEMRYLRPMSELRSLTLYGARVTDAGLENIAGLTKLRSLDIQATGVTDAGLAALEGLKDLRARAETP